MSKKIAALLGDAGYAVSNQTLAKYAASAGVDAFPTDYKAACAAAFPESQALVFIGAAGIAVRAIAPCLRSKLADPAIIVLDERANFIIPLVAGHIGGANELARFLADALGGTACVTTATDVNGLFAVDEWAARNNMLLASMKAAKEFAAALVRGEKAGCYHDAEFALASALPKQIELDTDLPIGMAITLKKNLRPFSECTLQIFPRILHLGIGCRRATPQEKIENFVLDTLRALEIDWRCVVSIASVDLKKDEQGLLDFARKYKLPANFYTAAQLQAVAGAFTPSAFVRSVAGVDNVCERSAVLDAGGGRLLLRKLARDGVTLAIAAEKLALDFGHTGLRTE